MVGIILPWSVGMMGTTPTPIEFTERAAASGSIGSSTRWWGITQTGLPIGPAKSNRVVVFGSTHQSSLDNIITSVSFVEGDLPANVAATKIEEVNNNSTENAQLWYAEVPSGTYCNVRITTTSTTTHSLHLFTFNTTRSTPYATANTIIPLGVGGDLVLSGINVPTGGGTLILAADDQTPATHTVSGATEANNFQFSTDSVVSAFKYTTGTGIVTITNTTDNENDKVGLAVTWRP